MRAGSGDDADGHRLRLVRAPDGSRAMTNATAMNGGHANGIANGAAESRDDVLGKDDVPESEAGLLMSTDPASGGAARRGGRRPGRKEPVGTHADDMDGGESARGTDEPMSAELLLPEPTRTAPPLKLWPLAVLVFYNVSGGPFGIEPSIRAGGNFFAILGFLLFPLVWSVPEALVTAELGSTFQDPSAGVAWVEEAFGETMACLCGYLAWVSGATDNAIYPTLFMEYVTSVVGWDDDDFSGWAQFGSVAAITICLAGLNYTGLEIVGNASMVVCVIAMSPFVILAIMAAPQIVPSRWLQMPEGPGEDDAELFDDDFQTAAGPLPLLTLGGILWRPYLNNLFWNLNSFDSAGSFSAETTSPSTTYPRGIFIGLVMCVLGYILPLLVAVGATDYRQADWVDGHLGSVCVEIGGPWLGAWTIFAAAISNLALFEAEMSSDAFQLMGMAERGYLPKIFQTRSKYGTPTAGIVFNTLVVVAFASADFGQLLELLNSVYAISLLMEYAAFVKLRLFHKQLQRPYRVPIPDWAAPIIVMPPTLGILVIFATSNWYVYYFCAGIVVAGVILFKCSDICKRLGWCEFETRATQIYQYAMPPLEDDNISEPTEGLSSGSPSDSDHSMGVTNEDTPAGEPKQVI